MSSTVYCFDYEDGRCSTNDLGNNFGLMKKPQLELPHWRHQWTVRPVSSFWVCFPVLSGARTQVVLSTTIPCHVSLYGDKFKRWQQTRLLSPWTLQSCGSHAHLSETLSERGVKTSREHYDRIKRSSLISNTRDDMTRERSGMRLMRKTSNLMRCTHVRS